LNRVLEPVLLVAVRGANTLVFDMAILLIFLVLQLCDAGTTLLFLGRGVTEGNPLMGALMHASDPRLALLAAKMAACGMALIAWRSRRMALLRRANAFFAFCVAWNVVAIATC
jgi:hypothetical protein